MTKKQNTSAYVSGYIPGRPQRRRPASRRKDPPTRKTPRSTPEQLQAITDAVAAVEAQCAGAYVERRQIFDRVICHLAGIERGFIDYPRYLWDEADDIRDCIIHELLDKRRSTRAILSRRHPFVSIDHIGERIMDDVQDKDAFAQLVEIRGTERETLVNLYIAQFMDSKLPDRIRSIRESRRW